MDYRRLFKIKNSYMRAFLQQSEKFIIPTYLFEINENEALLFLAIQDFLLKKDF